MAEGRDLEGRHFLVTGANTGIGRATAVALARRGARLFLAGRSRERTEPVLAEVQAQGGAPATFLPLDLESLASVRACAEEFLSLDVPLHVLVNNAGLAGRAGVTKDGFELAFGVNHLGTFLLTELLRDRIQRSAPGRIVNVSSRGHYQTRRMDWARFQRRTSSTTGLPEYNVSKLCNVLHASELARRLRGTGVTTYSLHPGVIASDVWREVPWPFRGLIKLFMQSTEEGARTSLHCAAAPEAAGETGLYYERCRPKRASALAEDEGLARELWSRSVEWTRPFGGAIHEPSG